MIGLNNYGVRSPIYEINGWYKSLDK
jgi:hypothetical protein